MQVKKQIFAMLICSKQLHLPQDPEVTLQRMWKMRVKKGGCEAAHVSSKSLTASGISLSPVNAASSRDVHKTASLHWNELTKLFWRVRKKKPLALQKNVSS